MAVRSLQKTLSILPSPLMRQARKRFSAEYTKAILLNGSNGQTLTEAAIKLEGEAYHRGYYKAFALTALVPSAGTACAPANPDSAPGGT